MAEPSRRSGGARRGYSQLNRIPADQVLHIFEPLEVASCAVCRACRRFSCG
ncbi:hypothetical protein P4056_23050 [Pseudomonas aeruginosa]|nr:hypothetical protein [Pseudomonas aeruginosa]